VVSRMKERFYSDNKPTKSGSKNAAKDTLENVLFGTMKKDRIVKNNGRVEKLLKLKKAQPKSKPNATRIAKGKKPIQAQGKGKGKEKEKEKIQDKDMDHNEDLIAEADKEALESDLSDEEVEEDEDDTKKNRRHNGKSGLKELLEKKPAWTDENEHTEGGINLIAHKRLRKLRVSEREQQVSSAEFESRLRKQFVKMYPNQDWALIPESKDDDLDLLRTTKPLVRRSPYFPSDVINITRVKDANHKEYSKSGIQAVEFHKSGKILMTAGFDKTIRLFQIDGKINEKIQSVHIEDFPIYSASFTPDGTQIISSSQRKYFYVFDLGSGNIQKIPWVQGRPEKALESFKISPCSKYLAFLGNHGYIILLSNKTKHWIASLKMNSGVKAICFSADSNYLYSFGDEGEVYKWDLRTQRCVLRYRDDGCVHGISIAISNDDKYLACGSDAGIVNLYDATELENNKQPIKSFQNLTMSISDLHFNHDSQILGFSSKFKKNSFRLVHVGSRGVFSNWPNSKTEFGCVNSFTFSPSSGFMAIGNNAGRVPLFRLNYYPAT